MVPRTETVCCALVLCLAWSAGCGNTEGQGASGDLLVVRCRCVRVLDGDTIEVLIDGTNEKVRVLGLQAPERREPHYHRAKHEMEVHVLGQDIELHVRKHGERGDMGRLLGYVHVDGIDVGAHLISLGLAREFRKYDHPRRAEYRKLETVAEREGTGLWSLMVVEGEEYRLKVGDSAGPEVCFHSKNSRVYHMAGCPSIPQITPHNLRTFPSPAAAEAAGLRLCDNCRKRLDR